MLLLDRLLTKLSGAGRGGKSASTAHVLHNRAGCLCVCVCVCSKSTARRLVLMGGCVLHNGEDMCIQANVDYVQNKPEHFGCEPRCWHLTQTVHTLENCSRIITPILHIFVVTYRSFDIGLVYERHYPVTHSSNAILNLD